MPKAIAFTMLTLIVLVAVICAAISFRLTPSGLWRIGPVIGVNWNGGAQARFGSVTVGYQSGSWLFERGTQSQHNRLKARSWEFLSLPNSAVEVLVDARRHGLVVLISNVFAYHLRVQEAVTANAAMPLVAGEDVRTPLGAFRVVFGIGHFNNQPSASAST